MDCAQVSHTLMLAMALRWCAGGSYLDICDLHGCHYTTFYRLLWLTVDACDKAYELPLLDLLSRVQQGSLAELAAGFDAKSSNGAFSGCIAAIDGIAIKLSKRSIAKESHPDHFYCYKGFHSLNFQVACDAHRRILWCSSKTAGSAHDSMALRLTELGEILEDPDHPIQDTPYWIAGDDAYKGNANGSRSLLTPYGGNNIGAEKDAFNFWQSHLRIEIECTFGAMVHRWGILQRKLSVPLKHATKLMHVLCKLHNKCIDRSLPDHKGRVLSDRYGSHDSHTLRRRHHHRSASGGDIWGEDWADWRIGEQYFDGAVPAGRRANAQPLRDILRDRLHGLGWVRPRGRYRGYTSGDDPAL